MSSSFLHKNNIGRGVMWTACECADLAQVWLSSSEDLILGIDQTSLHFNLDMFEKFSNLAQLGCNQK